jgi:hypothetical protein
VFLGLGELELKVDPIEVKTVDRIDVVSKTVVKTSVVMIPINW